MAIGNITDAVARAVEDASDSISEMFEPVIRIGVGQPDFAKERGEGRGCDPRYLA
ncbi:MAG: hypothetical protein ABGW81_04595 [Paracoccaceae bacterium]